MAGADDAHRRGAAVLLVVGVEDEQHVHRPLEPRVDLVLADLPHHRQEVRRERQVVVRVVERQADREPVAHGCERRHLGDQSQDLLVTAGLVVDLLGVVVERAECGDRADEHAHRVGVVVEAVDEALAHVLVDERVVGDVVGPLLQLRRVRQLAVQQEVGDLEVRAVLGQLLDRVAAVSQDAVVAVEVGDRALARSGLHVRRVVDEQRRIELAHRGGREHPVGDRYRHRLAGAIVSDGDGVGHVAPLVDTGSGGACSPAATLPGGSPARPSPSGEDVVAVVGLQRGVVVGAGDQALALVDQRQQCLTDDATCLGRIDHRVDQPAVGSDVRVQQPFGVVGLERGALLGRRSTLQDRRRLAGTHHGELGPRPREAQVVAHVLGVHDDVGAAVALAQDDADARHRGAGVGEHELRAVADHATPLEVLAGVEAWCVDQREERDVERVAEGDEPRSFLRRRDVQRAGQHDRLVGDDADGHPADGGERRDHVGGPAGADLEQLAVVGQRADHRAHVVAARGRRRDGSAGLRCVAFDRIVGRPARWLFVVVVGQVGQERRGLVEGGREVAGHQAGRARVASVAGRATELVVVHHHAGELGHHRRAAHERVGGLGHDHVVGEPDEQRRPGHRRTVDDHDRRHDAGAISERLRSETPAVQRAESFDDVGAAGAQDRHEREALGARRERGGLQDRRGIARQRTLAFGGIDVDPHDRAITEVTHVGPDRTGDLAAKGDAHVARS